MSKPADEDKDMTREEFWRAIVAIQTSKTPWETAKPFIDRTTERARQIYYGSPKAPHPKTGW